MTQINNTCYTDIEDLCVTARAWNLRFWQLERGGFHGELVQSAVGPAILSRARFSRKLRQTGEAPAQGWTFAIFPRTTSPLVWRGHAIQPGMMPIYKPSSEIEAISEPGFDVLAVTIDEATLDEAARDLGVAGWSRAIHGRDVVSCNPASLDTIYTHLSALLDRPSITNHAHGGGTLTIAKMIISTLVEPHISPASVHTMSPHLGVVQKIDALLMRHKGALTVADLIKEVGISERSIQRLFSRHFGTTPKTYIQTYRLHSVRSQLRASNPSSSSVSSIAAKFGYWHQGQFARDYRNFFEELPSDTLKSNTPDSYKS